MIFSYDIGFVDIQEYFSSRKNASVIPTASRFYNNRFISCVEIVFYVARKVSYSFTNIL